MGVIIHRASPPPMTLCEGDLLDVQRSVVFCRKVLRMACFIGNGSPTGSRFLLVKLLDFTSFPWQCRCGFCVHPRGSAWSIFASGFMSIWQVFGDQSLHTSHVICASEGIVGPNLFSRMHCRKFKQAYGTWEFKTPLRGENVICRSTPKA